MAGGLTHLNEKGEAHIVDIGDKAVTRRRAVAQARISGQAETIATILGGGLKKGDALAVARVAGIMAAKKTADLIPLCHPIPLTKVSVEIEGDGPASILIRATAETTGQTGVEMEALTAASVTALTLYDMAKAIDKLSENSDHETKTQSEAAFNQSFAKQFADIGLIVTAIMGAVFFTLLLLTGNTMAQAVRERIPELAVLKTIGFSNRSVLWLVLGESVLLVVLGGALGLAIAAGIMPAVSAASGGMIQLPTVLPQTWAMGLGLAALIGVVVGLMPALRGMRLNIVDALAGR